MTDRPLRIVFFGTPAFAVPTLEALLGSRHVMAGVVTQPDRPRGRGHRTTDAPVKVRAREAGIPILQPTSLKGPDFVAELAALDADLGVVAAYGRILTDAVLAVPRLGMINVHASLLPRYRGAAPVHRAVMAGERETGVTIMRVVKALDAGPMLSTATRPIAGEETSVDVEKDLAQIGARLLIEAVDRLAAGTAREEPQNDSEATYAHRLTKDDSPIDWARPARAAARPDPRSASLAARGDVSGRSTTDRAALAAWTPVERSTPRDDRGRARRRPAGGHRRRPAADRRAPGRGQEADAGP